jgi:ABC-type multidrug transport system ATPase subunit
LLKLHAIKEVQGVKDGCHIIVEDINEALFEIMNYVKSNNLTIKQINTHQPRLEDVFLKIIERGDSNE